MNAVCVREFGDVDELSLERIAVPAPQEGEVRVRVMDAGVGPWDALVRSGKSGLPQPLPLTPGSDISGIVEALGPNVAGLAVGDEVYGSTNPRFTGGYAEQAIANTGMLAKKPRSLTFAQAASAPVVAVTAWQMLFDHAKVRPGSRILVHGAAGNVGAYAVQLAHWKGAHVTALCRAEDVDFVRGLGVDDVVVYDSVPLQTTVAPVDVVIDTVGPAIAEPSIGVLKRGGIIVSSVAKSSEEAAQRAGIRTDFFFVDVRTDVLKSIAELFDRGLLLTNVGIVLPLAKVRDAHEMLAGKLDHPRGKIVLEMSG